MPIRRQREDTPDSSTTQLADHPIIDKFSECIYDDFFGLIKFIKSYIKKRNKRINKEECGRGPKPKNSASTNEKEYSTNHQEEEDEEYYLLEFCSIMLEMFNLKNDPDSKYEVLMEDEKNKNRKVFFNAVSSSITFRKFFMGDDASHFQNRNALEELFYKAEKIFLRETYLLSLSPKARKIHIRHESRLAQHFRDPSSIWLRRKDSTALPENSSSGSSSDNTKHVLVLDLDQTLVDSGPRLYGFPRSCLSEELRRTCDASRPSQTFGTVYYFLRPGAKEFVELVSQHFEVVVFTAAGKFHCDQVCHLLDPDRKFIHHRRWDYHLSGDRSKDLSLLNRPLHKIILIDDCRLSFLHHPENAIRINPHSALRANWKNDKELHKIYLWLVERLSGCSEVYDAIEDYYKMSNESQERYFCFIDKKVKSIDSSMNCAIT